MVEAWDALTARRDVRTYSAPGAPVGVGKA